MEGEESRKDALMILLPFQGLPGLQGPPGFSGPKGPPVSQHILLGGGGARQWGNSLLCFSSLMLCPSGSPGKRWGTWTPWTERRIGEQPFDL